MSREEFELVTVEIVYPLITGEELEVTADVDVTTEYDPYMTGDTWYKTHSAEILSMKVTLDGVNVTNILSDYIESKIYTELENKAIDSITY